jgi:hypothetical protein
MATIFTWSIDRMSTLQEPQQNFVVEVVWRLTGVDEIYSPCIGNRITLNSTSSETFIPYEELTEEIVIAWVLDALGVDGVNSAKAQVQAYIDRMINPPTVVALDTPLPWVQE